jgi:hypothetical protein
MNTSQRGPLVSPVGIHVAGRRLAFAILAACLLGVAGAPSLRGTPADAPSVSAGMGPCSADFMVVDASNKPVFNAKIHVKVKYGFMGKSDSDLEVGTNSDGKARIEGLPKKVKKPPLEFSIQGGGATKSVTNDPAAECHPYFNVTLGN